MTTLQPLQLPPLTSGLPATGGVDPRASPQGRHSSGQRVSPGVTAKGQDVQKTSPGTGVKVARNVSGSQRSSGTQPPPKPPRKTPSNSNAAYLRSPRSPSGGVKTANVNKNVRGASHGSPTQPHPVVNVNERRSRLKTSPNGNRSFVIKTSPNGNSGIPAFAGVDNSSVRRQSVKEVSPSCEKPPKPTRRSSLKEQRPANSSPNNNKNLKKSLGERTSGADESYLHYPQFSHLLPSKSKIRQNPPAHHPQRGIDASRHKSSVTPHRVAHEGNANGYTSHSSNSSSVCCRALGSERNESFPQFPEGRREIENGEGDAATLPNVPNDPQEATVTLNVSDTIRRRIPRVSLNLEEENFLEKLKREVDIDLIEGGSSPCLQSRFTLAVVDDPAEVVLEVVSSRSIRLRHVNFSQVAPRSEPGENNKLSSEKRTSVREELPWDRTSLNHSPKEALANCINNSERR